MKKVIFVIFSLVALSGLTSCFQHRVCATYTLDTSQPEEGFDIFDDTEAL